MGYAWCTFFLLALSVAYVNRGAILCVEFNQNTTG